MLASTVLAAPPVLCTVLVLAVALLALRAVTREQGVNHARRLGLVLDATILVALMLFAVLVVVRFESLA
jgi:hypothetical protein